MSNISLFPVKKQNFWQIDVPADNSCLFWAVVCAYLVPCVDDGQKFQERFTQLFGVDELEQFDAIKHLFKSYNPFANQQMFEDINLRRLVQEVFRVRVVQHMQHHKEVFADFWASQNNQLEANFGDYLTRMCDVKTWGGNLEIKAISELLNCNLSVSGFGVVQDYQIVNSAVQLTLMHVNVETGEAKGEGDNHYHYALNTNVGDAYQKAAAIAVTSPATLMNVPVKNVNALSTNARKEEKIQKDKVADIKILFGLYTRLGEFFVKKTDVHLVSRADIVALLIDIAKVCADVSWNVKSAQHIRNIYGKMNYKKGARNEYYIDFDRLSLLHRFPDSEAQEKIISVFISNIAVFLADIDLLRNNVLFLLKTELFSNKKLPALIGMECQEMLHQLDAVVVAHKKLVPLANLLPLYDCYYDILFVQKICQPQLVQAFISVAHEIDSDRWRYAFARVLTLLGEASKNLSDTFKANYDYLPLTVLAKLRDQLGHVHHIHIARNNRESLAIYSQIVTDDLPSLQEEMATILSLLLAHSTPEQVMKNHKPADSLDNLKLEARKPLDMNKLISLPLRAKLRLLKEREAILKIETNKIKQALNKPVPTPALVQNSMADMLKAEQRCLDKIKSLDGKTGLTSQENKMLESAKKELVRLERKKQPSSVVAPVQPASSKKYDELISELSTVRKELEELRVSPNFYKLLHKFTDFKKGKKKSAEEKLKARVASLEKEIHILKNLSKSTLKGERDYAVEHSIAVIGQLMRELNECAGLILDVLQQNRAIKSAFDSNIFARNKKVMHDPFSDNSLYLDSVVVNDALPLSFDIEAMQVILNAQSPAQISQNALFATAKTYTKLGHSYLRLSLLEEAEKYFIKALDQTDSKYWITFYKEGENSEVSQQSKSPTVEIVNGVCVIKQGNDVIIMADMIWVNNRVHALINLALCLMRQEKFDQAKIHLAEAYEMYKKIPGHDFHFKLQMYAHQMIASLRAGHQDIAALRVPLNALKKHDYNLFTMVVIHAGYMILNSAQNYLKGLEITSEVEYKLITDIKVQLNIYLLDGLLAASHADAIDTEGKIGGFRICESSLQFRKQAIDFLQGAFTLYTRNQAALRTADGDYIETIYRAIRRNLAAACGTQAARLLYYKPLEAYTLIKTALQLQKRFRLGTSTSYLTLASICEQLFEKTKEIKYLEEGLTAYEQVTTDSSLHSRAIAYAGKASILFELSRVSDAVPNCIESLFYYSLVPAAVKDNFDQSEEKNMGLQLEKIAAADNNICRAVLANYQTAADKYLSKKNIKEAEVNYKKCLIALTYLSDPELQMQISKNLALCAASVSGFSQAQQMWSLPAAAVATATVLPIEPDVEQIQLLHANK